MKAYAKKVLMPFDQPYIATWQTVTSGFGSLFSSYSVDYVDIVLEKTA